MSNMDLLFTDQFVSEADTKAFAAKLSDILRQGDIITLTGDLGAGKSTLARAAIRHMLGNDALDVPSPTFTILQTYSLGKNLEICHADLYRLHDEEELEELGFEDMRDNAVFFVEWPEKLPSHWHQDALHILLKNPSTVSEGHNAREIQIVGNDDWKSRLVSANLKSENISQHIGQ